MPFKNTEKAKEYRKIYYEKNKEFLKAKALENHYSNRERNLENSRKRYRANKQHYIDSAKQWAKDNPEKRRAIENKYQRTHTQLHRMLRGRLRDALYRQNVTKFHSALYLVGCSLDELKLHLQDTAINNGYSDFDINNYNTSKYEVDHIIPCAVFTLKCNYHQKLCFHWSNLQILRSDVNRIKSDSLIHMNVSNF